MYVKVRFLDKQNDKTFRQYAPSKNLGWVPRNRAGVAPILYRTNTLASADEIFVVNGEKAADRGGAELGIVTTCTPDGEGKWRGEYTRPLIGKAVRIVIDNDAKGAAHGAVISAAIVKHVREVKVIRLQGCLRKATSGTGSKPGARASSSMRSLPTLRSRSLSRTSRQLAAAPGRH